MKIYGNSKSDGFSAFVLVIGALFIAGGFLLGHVGSLTLLASVPAFLALSAAMVLVVRRWDVMSEVEAPKTTGEGAVVTALPTSIDKPKSAVETNTAVAA